MIEPQTRAPWWKNTRGEWYVIIQIGLFALIALGPTWLDIRLDLPGGVRAAALVIGGVLAGAGLLLALAGLLALGPNLSALPHPKDDAELVESGPYRLVRHPIYSGVILGAIGWALLNASLLTLIYAVLLFVFFDIKSRCEERWLRRKFAGYAAYQARVSKLLPFIY